MGAVDLKRAQAAQDKLLGAVGADPEVNGVGIARADGGHVLRVNLRSASARERIPGEIEGVTVEVRIVGPIRKRQAV